jgi:hypothetical protein
MPGPKPQKNASLRTRFRDGRSYADSKALIGPARDLTGMQDAQNSFRQTRSSSMRSPSLKVQWPTSEKP